MVRAENREVKLVEGGRRGEGKWRVEERDKGWKGRGSEREEVKAAIGK